MTITVTELMSPALIVSTGTQTLTTTVSAPANSLILVVAMYYQGQVGFSGCADSLGNTYTMNTDANIASGQAGGRSAMAQASSFPAGTVITCTVVGGLGRNYFVLAITGLASSSIVDQYTGLSGYNFTNLGGGAVMCPVVSPALAQANEIVMCYQITYVGAVTVDSPTVASSYYQGTGPLTSSRVDYQIVTNGLGPTFTPTANGAAGSGQFAGWIESFRAAAGAPVTPTPSPPGSRLTAPRADNLARLIENEEAVAPVALYERWNRRTLLQTPPAIVPPPVVVPPETQIYLRIARVPYRTRTDVNPNDQDT